MLTPHHHTANSPRVSGRHRRSGSNVDRHNTLTKGSPVVQPVSRPPAMTEHPDVCAAEKCKQRPLPGSDYCMKHQNRA